MVLKRISSVAAIAVGLFAAAGTLFTVAAQYSTDYLYTTTATDSAAAATFAGVSLIWVVCACCVPLIIDVVLAYWVMTDAKKHNVENPILWAALTFFFSLLALLVYLLAIRPEAIKKQGGAAPKVVEGTVQDHKPE